MLAGEGLGGVFQALLAVVGVDGSSAFSHPLFLLNLADVGCLQSLVLPSAALGWSSADKIVVFFLYDWRTVVFFVAIE
jgi:hypothetical protein